MGKMFCEDCLNRLPVIKKELPYAKTKDFDTLNKFKQELIDNIIFAENITVIFLEIITQNIFFLFGTIQNEKYGFGGGGILINFAGYLTALSVTKENQNAGSILNGLKLIQCKTGLNFYVCRRGEQIAGITADINVYIGFHRGFIKWP